MALFDKIRGEFVDIVEWLDDSRDTLVWRFPRYENEIKMGARLVVRESQVAVFVNEGRIADAFGPGTYTLETRNLPILSTLKGWKHGFHSPFKAEVYFVGTRQYADFKWGTQNPIMVRDPEFGPVRLRAFGAYAARVTDAPALLRELAGTDGQFRTEEVEGYLRQMVVGRLAHALATTGLPVLDLAADQHEMGRRLAEALTADLAGVGLAIPAFTIENISLPPEVERALDKRSKMGIVGDLGDYTRFQAAEALENAGGAADGMGLGVGLGVGIAAGRQMADALTPPAGPPPLPRPAQWFLGVDGERLGPFEAADLPAAGLTPDVLVWRTGMPQWVPAGDVPELAALLNTGPPPLPPV
ncbi:Membrane protease subunit, stomatin/prohibitin family, contains C-terminal Zn-ribbon domain [Nonomuraea solani]|uniref:Membrane protease subunit, stomatin/prohibitin family, contains C-terminal Zn-ribbon domain n=1 Tax=Nonomuraea solani TaxID=1144553 RepID=A0A1H6C3Q2_9ACTN|nr:SPFH domain-containing protein [Nonomuraea solani]SEG67006.1 Membrane protease subunit, stomatin/prohibitin family, contains C-terminal Zn-ribbon domain [Nonomuraea solani]